jgi:hypothetical protein
MNWVRYDHAGCCRKHNATVRQSYGTTYFCLVSPMIQQRFHLNLRTELTKMDFFYTQTMVFDIVQFDQIEFATARLNTENWSSYHNHLQHELYGGDLVGVSPTLCTTLDKMHGIAQIAAPEQPGDLGWQVKSFFRQIVSFRTKIDPTSEVMKYYARVNIYCMHNEVPPCIQGMPYAPCYS